MEKQIIKWMLFCFQELSIVCCFKQLYLFKDFFFFFSRGTKKCPEYQWIQLLPHEILWNCSSESSLSAPSDALFLSFIALNTGIWPWLKQASFFTGVVTSPEWECFHCFWLKDQFFHMLSRVEDSGLLRKLGEPGCIGACRAWRCLAASNI